MARYVQPAVRELADEPTSGERVELVVVPEDGAADAVETCVAELGGRVTREIELGMFAVEIDETAVDALCDESAVQSVTFDEELSVLDSGNANP
jgi:hypothetical protein